MDRSIVYLRVPAFQIAVERVCRAELRGRPLVIAPSGSERSLVQAASDEARQVGIRSGMRVKEALRICRDLKVLPPNLPLYARAEAAMLDILKRYTPFIEPQPAGSAYLDVTASVRLFGGAADIAWRAEEEIRRELRLDPSAGVAINKLVSGVAGRQSPPREFLQVPAGEERPFLAPLRVFLLPSVDRRTYHKLLELNFRRIGELAKASPHHLEWVLGRKGRILHQQAKGEDFSPVIPPSSVPQVKRRSELAEDSNDAVLLKAELFGLVVEALAEIGRRGRAARTLHIDILYSDL